MVWLRKKILLYTSALFLGVLILVMTVLYLAIEDTLYDNAKESAFSVANSIYIALDDNIFSAAQLVTLVGNDPFLADYLEKSDKDVVQLNTYLTNLSQVYPFELIRVASFQEDVLYSSEGYLKTFDAAKEDDAWYYDIKNQTDPNKNYFPILSQNSDQLYYNGVYLIRDEKNAPIGFILIGFNYTYSLSSIKTSIQTLKAHVYMMDSRGNTQSNLLSGLNETPLPLNLSLKEVNLEDVSSHPNSFAQFVEDKTSVTIKYIRQLDSYLIITQDLSSNIFYTFLLILLVVVLVLSLILLITLRMLNYSSDKMMHEASLDPLTNVYNRSMYGIKLNESIELCKHYNITSSLIIIDIDNFKVINDEMGHGIGDEIIIQVAKMLDETKRKNDILFRWGGDEFCIIVRSNRENTLLLASRILEASRNICWKENHPVTLSIGVTEVLSNDTKKLVFNRADDALYQAKEQGKNTACYC